MHLYFDIFCFLLLTFPPSSSFLPLSLTRFFHIRLFLHILFHSPYFPLHILFPLLIFLLSLSLVCTVPDFSSKCSSLEFLCIFFVAVFTVSRYTGSLVDGRTGGGKAGIDVAIYGRPPKPQYLSPLFVTEEQVLKGEANG